MNTKREVELELQLWTERAEHVKVKVALLNAQAQNVNAESVQCVSEVNRIKALLATMPDPESPVAAPAAA